MYGRIPEGSIRPFSIGYVLTRPGGNLGRSVSGLGLRFTRAEGLGCRVFR